MIYTSYTSTDEIRREFYRNLDGLSIDAIKDVAWRHYAAGAGLVLCEVCDRWFFLEEEGGSDVEGVKFCGEHWKEMLDEAQTARPRS